MCITEAPLLYYDTQHGPQEVLRPYEQQWGMHLPNDMKKDANKYRQSVSKDKEICLVNVGQAAESIACALGFEMGCGTKLNHDLPVGLLPHHTTHMFRQNVYDCFEDSAYYLFVLRNPLDRLILILAFRNSRRSGKLYADCQINTIGDLVNIWRCRRVEARMLLAKIWQLHQLKVPKAKDDWTYTSTSTINII
jgi:hypothetical protein